MSFDIRPAYTKPGRLGNVTRGRRAAPQTQEALALPAGPRRPKHAAPPTDYARAAAAKASDEHAQLKAEVRDVIARASAITSDFDSAMTSLSSSDRHSSVEQLAAAVHLLFDEAETSLSRSSAVLGSVDGWMCETAASGLGHLTHGDETAMYVERRRCCCQGGTAQCARSARAQSAAGRLRGLRTARSHPGCCCCYYASTLLLMLVAGVVVLAGCCCCYYY